MIEIEEDDYDFLAKVAEAEAHALSNKRRRIINSLDAVEKKKEVIEGAYTAALRGSRSLLWQQQTSLLNSTRSRVKPSNYHNQSNAAGGSTVDFNVSSEPLIPEKTCPCGLGACVVFTANTQRNHGRKFYKCPVRQENGGCGFFEWCDNASGMNNNPFGGSPNNACNSMFPDLPCPCGAGSCLILTAKTGKNIGQQFYRCPLDQGSSCGFFKWCNDNVVAAGLPVNAPKVFNNMNEPENNSNSIRTGYSCFKCGNEGHWAKDCPLSSSNIRSSAEIGGKAASSASSACYKCGKPGHWARNCTSTQYMPHK